MTDTGDGAVTRNDIERALWVWSEWRADQRAVDALLTLIDQYAGSRAVAELLDEARHEAAQIVQSAHDEAAVVASAVRVLPDQVARTMTLGYTLDADGRVYRDAAGVLWLLLGDATGAVIGETRVCSTCRTVKPLSRFAPEGKSKTKRKAKCRDCENGERRMKWQLNKVQDKGEVA